MEEPTVTVSVRLPQDLRDDLALVCKGADITISQLFRIWAKGVVQETKNNQVKPEPKKDPAPTEIRTGKPLNREQRRKLRK